MEIVEIDGAFHLPEETSVTIGFFDGVHVGHRFLLKQLETLSSERGLQSGIITFPQHPATVLNTDYIPSLLNTPEEKMGYLAQSGVKYCFLLRFDRELAQKTAREFMEDILCKKLNAKQLVIGYDHRFGRDRHETFENYREYGKEFGIEVVQAEELTGYDAHVSSSKIRNLLYQGSVERAGCWLTYPYGMEGRVVPGDRLGRKIGFPTANLKALCPDKVIPGVGIYAGTISFDGRRHPGMIYIGRRPTVHSGDELRIEAHIFDYSGELYGRTIRIEFVRFLRDDRKFESVDALRQQLERDKQQALEGLY